MTDQKENSRGPDFASIVSRIASIAGLVFWPVVFGFLWFHAPWGPRLLALAWASLGAFAPRLYLPTLAALFPLFGNNPGGEHALYLLDMGLMGFVGRDLALKAMGRREVRSGPFNGLIRLFFLISTITLIPQRMNIYCEAVVFKSQFVFNMYNLYGTAAMYGMRVWFDLALSLSFFAALRDDLLPERWREWLWRTFLASLAVASILGVLDYFKLVSLEFWRGENPYITQFGFRRLQSLFWHSGWFAQYLSALAPAALALGLAPHDPERRRRRVPWLICAALLGVTQLLTFQRGGWIALAAGYGVVIAAALMHSNAERRRRLMTRAAAALAAVAFAVVMLGIAIPSLGHRMLEIGKLEDRAKIWKSGLVLGTMSPLSGSGLGNYHMVHRYRFPAGHPFNSLDKVTPHNSYIYVFAERGIFAALAYCAIIFGAIALLWREAAKTNRVATRLEVLSLLGGLVGMAVYSIFQDISYLRILELLFWLFLALASGEVAQKWTFSIDRRDRPGKKNIWIVGVLAIFALMFYEERQWFVPYRLNAPDGKDYLPGGAEVRLTLPQGASRVAIPLFWADSRPGQEPVEFSLEVGGRKAGSVTFTESKTTSVTLELSNFADSNRELVIRSSRTWSPYFIFGREVPILENGVNYREPVAVP